MKKIFTTLLIVCSVTLCKAQWVTIPDNNFINWIDNSFSSCLNGNQLDTTCPLLSTIHYININNYGINDLTGIQYFDSLTTLICYSNNLTFLPPLPSHLDTLFCYFNQLTSLPSLPITLTCLRCGYNDLDSLPALPSGLQELNCQANSSLDSLPALPSTLTLLNCQTSSIDFLPFLPTGLKVIIAGYNGIDNLPPLPDSLNYFICENNHLSIIPPLPLGLIYFRCGMNYLDSLPELPPVLDYLDCRANNISSLSVIPSSLTYLNCGQNLISSLPALPDTLINLFCDHNQLAALPLLPSHLNKLAANDNQLTSLTPLPYSMYSLELNNNPSLTCLPPLGEITTGLAVHFNISNTGIICLPNQIQHPNCASIPQIDTTQICGVFNVNGCPIGANIVGSAILDADANCSTSSSADIYLTDVKIQLYDNNNTLLQQVYSNTGSFSFYVPLDSFQLRIDTTNLPFNVLCPSTNNHVSVLSVSSSIDDSADFLLTCNSGYDLAVNTIYRSQGLLFPTNHSTFKIEAGDLSSFYSANCNTVGLSGTVTINVSGDVSIDSASSSSNASGVINGNNITWNVLDFSQLDFTNTLFFILQTDSFAQVGSSVCVNMTISASSGTDDNMLNNSLTHCFYIVSSFDPNIKEVYPAHVSTTGNWLTYDIHFQNTGTAPAQNILVIDTLDSNLDWSTFQLLSVSHQNLTQIFQDGIIHFNFPNIYLPDSSSDEPHSHGHIQYRIKIKNNVSPPQLIHNIANIYFDLNAPVVTNDAAVDFCVADVANVNATICEGNIFVFNNNSYSVTGTYPNYFVNLSGCDSIITLNLTVETINTTIQQSNDTLTATSTGTIQWLDCNTQQLISGATQTVFVPTVTGNYAAIITEGNCSDTSNCFQVFTGVNELQIGGYEFEVYPNPTGENITVTLLQPCEDSDIEITNTLGEIVQSSKFKVQSEQLNIHSLPDGIYFITVRSDKFTAVKKIVKQ